MYFRWTSKLSTYEPNFIDLSVEKKCSCSFAIKTFYKTKKNITLDVPMRIEANHGRSSKV